MALTRVDPQLVSGAFTTDSSGLTSFTGGNVKLIAPAAGTNRTLVFQNEVGTQATLGIGTTGSSAGTGNFYVQTNAGYALAVTSTSLVGIGTNNPSSLVHLYGNDGTNQGAASTIALNLQNSNGAASSNSSTINFLSDYRGNNKIATIAGYLIASDNSGAYGNLNFYTTKATTGTSAPSLSMGIDYAGRVGIAGAASSPNSYGTNYLTISNAGSSGMGVYNTTMSVGSGTAYVQLGYTSSYSAGIQGYIKSGQPGVDRVSLGLNVTTYTSSLQTFYTAVEVGDNGYVYFNTPGPTQYGQINADSGYIVIGSQDVGFMFLGGSGAGQRRIIPRKPNSPTNASDNLIDLGDSGSRYRTIYAGTGSINTSDRNEKQDIEELDVKEKAVAVSIKSLIKKYRFKDAVIEKGEGARIHVGVIAQEVQDAFTAQGLDASRYGMFCSDTWYEIPITKTDNEGNETIIMSNLTENGLLATADMEGAVEKTRMAIRYDELLAFVISAL
jgi:hypothetical protein